MSGGVVTGEVVSGDLSIGEWIMLGNLLSPLALTTTDSLTALVISLHLYLVVVIAPGTSCLPHHSHMTGRRLMIALNVSSQIFILFSCLF